MVEIENENTHKFMDKIKSGLSYIPKIISASISQPIADSAELVMNKIDDKIVLIEKRIMRKMYSLLTIGFGAVVLIFALFFFLRESLGWSNAAALFSIGITVFVIGLLMKLGEPNRQTNSARA